MADVVVLVASVPETNTHRSAAIPNATLFGTAHDDARHVDCVVGFMTSYTETDHSVTAAEALPAVLGAHQRKDSAATSLNRPAHCQQLLLVTVRPAAADGCLEHRVDLHRHTSRVPVRQGDYLQACRAASGRIGRPSAR